ncbi:P2X purinoceptor 1 [Papio anubis]|uniref:P2X purinoceptor 1 n=1 Tax=Papio anubis TaxID=9555 RepID=UPI0012ADA2FE|nr:P2X purinoceptor 1 [Papio anubis]
MARRFQEELAAFLFEYDTPRMVLVRNKKVGVIFRLIQLVVLVYVIGLEGLPGKPLCGNGKSCQLTVEMGTRPAGKPCPWAFGGQGAESLGSEEPAPCYGSFECSLVLLSDLQGAAVTKLRLREHVAWPQFQGERGLGEEYGCEPPCRAEMGVFDPEIPDLNYVCPWQGGVVGVTIDWHCDLDWHVRHCKPIYEFHGLYEEKNLSPGFNFRFARHFVENGTNHRHLFKVFGIRFDILVDGKAGKFDIIPTMTTIGSGIGIFGVATVLCDLLLLHILPKRHYYKQKKFKYAEDMGPGADERDLAATGSTLGLQENMRTS